MTITAANNLCFDFYQPLEGVVVSEAIRLPRKAVDPIKRPANACYYQLPLPFNRMNLDKALCLAPSPIMVHRDWVTSYITTELLERYKIFKASRNSTGKNRFHGKKYAAVLSMLLANLFNAYSMQSQVLIPRKTAHFQDNDSNPEGFSNKVISDVADFLADEGLIVLVLGSDGYITGGSCTWAIASPLLVSMLQKHEARIRLHDKSSLLELRDSEGLKIKTPNKRLTSARLSPVIRHNQDWQNHTATLGGYPLLVDLKRVFNISKGLDLGGRFYAPYQQIPSAKRHNILIDGEPTIELDYKANHFAILYAWEGLPLIGDPYYIDGMDRQTVKRACLTLLNSEDLTRFVQNVTRSGNPSVQAQASSYASLRECYNIMRAKGLKAVAPRKPRSLEGFIEGIRSGTKGADVLEAILERHRAIHHHIGSRHIGLRLQYADSQVMNGVLGRLQGVPVLPVHDSIRCRVSDAEQVRQAMLEAFMEVTGQACTVELKTLNPST